MKLGTLVGAAIGAGALLIPPVVTAQPARAEEPHLVCKRVEGKLASTGDADAVKNNGVARSVAPADKAELAGGFIITGGGCEGFGPSVPITQSVPNFSNDGYICSIWGASSSVKAYAVACKIGAPQ
jgi:hypothetical protein